jgi:hypothetical protein
MINAGEELYIDYGKDYWAERSGFGTVAQQPNSVQSGVAVAKGEDKNESAVQPNAEDITNTSVAKQFGQPNSNANPAVSGIAIKGIGQQ